MKLIAILLSFIIFSSLFVGTVYGAIYIDKKVYTWTDKVHIRIMDYALNADNSFIRVYTSDHELRSYKLSKAGNGLYTGEIILTGFLHDVDGDGKPDTNPRTFGTGAPNGFLETGRDGGFTVSLEFSDGRVINKSAKISWNEGKITFDMPSYVIDDSAKLQVIDPDLNLNPDTLDTIKVHVFSDSDKAGILVKAIETKKESGLFETMVSFTQDRNSSGNRLFVIPGDAIYAKYEDHTLPAPYRINDNLDIIAESAIKNDLQSSQKAILDNIIDSQGISIPAVTFGITNKDGDSLSSTKLGETVFFNPSVYNPFESTKKIDYVFHIIDDGEVIFLNADTISLEGKTSIDIPISWITSKTGFFNITFESFHHNTNTKIGPVIHANIHIYEYNSPLKQFKSGASITEIKCKEDLVLIQKINNFPACVTPETHLVLIERGWASDKLEYSNKYTLTVKEFAPSGTNGLVGLGAFFNATAVEQWCEKYNGKWDDYYLYYCYFDNEDDMNQAREGSVDFPTMALK